MPLYRGIIYFILLIILAPAMGIIYLGIYPEYNLFVKDYMYSIIVPPENQYGVIVMDLDRDGIELIPLAKSKAAFDFDKDRFIERTAWVGKDDAFLVLDLNGDDRVSSLLEVLGNHGDNGFERLKKHDLNKDLIIDERDDIWERLRVWRDRNSNSISDPNELAKMGDYNLHRIYLPGYAFFPTLWSRLKGNQSVSGNYIFQESEIEFKNRKRSKIALVQFELNQQLTLFNGVQKKDPRTRWVPDLRGFGKVPNLSMSMSMNPQLLEQCWDLLENEMIDAFFYPDRFDAKFTDFLLNWAELSNINRKLDNGLDEAKLLFIEKITGQKFIIEKFQPKDVMAMEETWRRIHRAHKAYFLLQSSSSFYRLFKGGFTYTPYYGDFQGTAILNEEGVRDVFKWAHEYNENFDVFLVELGKFLNSSKGFKDFSNEENAMMQKYISQYSDQYTWDEIKDIVKKAQSDIRGDLPLP